MQLTDKTSLLLFILLCESLWCGSHRVYANSESDRAQIIGGDFYPHYGPGGSKKAVHVKTFWMDRLPVTQAEYSEFLKKNPSWLPTKPSRLLVEDSYLSDWKKLNQSSVVPERKKKKFPVIFVSYFAASAYCESKKGRLATTLEWEYAAQEKPEDLMGWFTNPKPPGEVGRGKPNRFGVSDLHGHIWEWTQDFNSSFASADNREDGFKDKNLFCGAGAMNARDRENYPAFMRYAMRSALRANYVMSNLGFRCAYDEE